MKRGLIDLPTVRYETNPPDPTGTAGVFRRIGYSLDEALADLIDNSIDARAKQVLIRFFRRATSLERVVIADDGRGMSEDVLKKAMQYGVQAQHDAGDLGKYGIGLKSASFSQCRSLSVISRSDGNVAGRRWTLRSIEQGWKQEVVRSAAAGAMLDQDWCELELSQAGTLVLWDDLDFISQALGRLGIEVALSDLIKSLTINLGLRFHRFLKAKKIRLLLDTVNLDESAGSVPVSVTALDPFGYPSTGHRGFPVTFHVDLGTPVQLALHAHIWPAKSNDINYKLGGGRVAARQGFYFYRNDRLIQGGGWNGLQSDTEPHYSLARVAIDLPPEMDSLFRLSVQKSKIDPPAGFIPAVEGSRAGVTSVREYLNEANQVYRSKQPLSTPLTVVPGKGVPASLLRSATKILASETTNVREIAFSWIDLPTGQFFEIDRENGQILLNQSYRRAVLGRARSSSADVPVVKTLVFLLAEELFARQRSSRAEQRWLERANSLIVAALRRSGG